MYIYIQRLFLSEKVKSIKLSEKLNQLNFDVDLIFVIIAKGFIFSLHIKPIIY